ncbi:hypothetical protein [Parageobacillus thermoglucosidasius]|uniref:RiboL-PSP-HEPN domain-containing protein n=1 Tax=Parageobacillus thermoglucosidasius TaxID=1426 RepID=A0A1B7KP99_PARTM|nr:hypothetical protein [Parageobacillus thermoglucosidasius]OAT71891.1 hypothetical protein A7K69_10800 [Parageobacillus thermoglucosidasius]
MSTNDMPSSIIITNMPQEMYNDGLYYLNEAKKLNCDQRFAKWRFFRSAIINFCISTETFLHQTIVHHLKQKNTLNKYEQDWLDFLENPNSTIDIKTLKHGINVKSKFINVLGWIISSDLTKNHDYMSKFNNYKNLTEFRNKIVHYSTSNHSPVYRQIENWANQAPDIASEMIIAIHHVAPIHANPPSWVLSKAYIDFDDRR